MEDVDAQVISEWQASITCFETKERLGEASEAEVRSKTSKERLLSILDDTDDHKQGDWPCSSDV